MAASSAGDPALVRLLLKYGTDVDEKRDWSKIFQDDDFNGATALIMATKNKNPDIVSLLLENGADVNIADNRGRTFMDIINNDSENEAVKEAYDEFKKRVAKEIRAGYPIMPPGIEGVIASYLPYINKS